MPRPRRASTFVGQTPVCRTKVQLAVPATGTKRRTTDRSFPASKIIRGSLRRHSVFKVQYYAAAARAANPSDGLRRSGAASRFRGPDGVLSCGRKRECIPDRTHVLVFTWTDVRTCSHMSRCTNTNILARPLAGKSESEHPHTHDYQHPFTNSCKRSCPRIRTQSHYLIQTPIHCGTHPCKSVRMQPEGRRRKILAHGTRRLVASLRHEAQRIGRGLRLSAVEHLHPARMRTACIEIYEPTTRIRLEGP